MGKILLPNCLFLKKTVKKPLSLIVWDKLLATRMGLILFGVVKLAFT